MLSITITLTTKKSEIKKIVRELLETELIRQPKFLFITYPTSKVDGNWRMCVDYMSLNNETVRDKYSIPVIDKLLDELNDATIY